MHCFASIHSNAIFLIDSREEVERIRKRLTWTTPANFRISNAFVFCRQNVLSRQQINFYTKDRNFEPLLSTSIYKLSNCGKCLSNIKLSLCYRKLVLLSRMKRSSKWLKQKNRLLKRCGIFAKLRMLLTIASFKLGRIRDDWWTKLPLFRDFRPKCSGHCMLSQRCWIFAIFDDSNSHRIIRMPTIAISSINIYLLPIISDAYPSHFHAFRSVL